MNRNVIPKWAWISKTARREAGGILNKIPNTKFGSNFASPDFNRRVCGSADPPGGIFDHRGWNMQPRLTSDLWVSAYLTRLRLADIPAYITAKGDPTAGAVIVKVATLNGQARAFQRSFDLMSDTRIWVTLTEGAELEVDALITRQRGRDPDLWVIELEDRQGRTLLDQSGLDG
jgi:hypothetical protein